MSELPQNVDDLGELPSRVETRGYHLGLAFQPPVRLHPKEAYNFAQKLADFVEPSQVQVEQDRWTFSQREGRSPRGQLSIRVEPSQLLIEGAFPTLAREWHENRQAMVFRKFGEAFRPSYIVQSAAQVRGVLPIDKDARRFLAENVMKIDATRIQPIGRPIHVVGLRFECPPIPPKPNEHIEGLMSVLNVRVESLAEDPTRLFLEVEANWPTPMAWTDPNLQQVVARLDVVTSYMKKNVLQFLFGFDEPGGEVEHE